MPSGNSTLRIRHSQWLEPLKVGRQQGTDICITVERLDDADDDKDDDDDRRRRGVGKKEKKVLAKTD
ncbi:hypothetical protein GBF38_014809 [Nibea albiflora]|uniref:Uncharacterized protein n=1 Tax=Nibea albiflora TaxID=240163 RepID=A0ACB7EKT2_NIBAL|nr:hypothetical protein GBF38_014809 [Nibea albiflora]